MTAARLTQACPIRGHAHDCHVVADHTQDGTGATAATVECPTGQYRWFVIDGRVLSDATRQVRPRWGWK